MAFAGSVLVLVSISITVALLERTALCRSAAPRPSRRPYLGTDLAWYVVTIAAGAVAAFLFRPTLEHLAWNPVAHMTRRWPLAWQSLAAIAIYDLVAYAVHVGYHRSDLLWEFHKVHHSSLHLDGLAATRTHMFEHLTRGLPAQGAVLALGFRAPALAVALSVYAVFAVAGHGDLDLPFRPFERLVITPRLHYLHHDAATANRNYATVLSVWDRMFKTYDAGRARSDLADLALGVPGDRETYPQNFRSAAREPFRRILRPTLSAADTL